MKKTKTSRLYRELTAAKKVWILFAVLFLGTSAFLIGSALLDAKAPAESALPIVLVEATSAASRLTALTTSPSPSPSPTAAPTPTPSPSPSVTPTTAPAQIQTSAAGGIPETAVSQPEGIV